MMWLGGGDKNICIVTPLLWFREPFWISHLILGVWKQLTWKTPVPRVRNNPLWLKFWDFRQGHKSQSRGMLSSTLFMVLSSMAISRYYPRTNNSPPPPPSHGLDCTSKLLMMLTGEKTIFHMMHGQTPPHSISFPTQDKGKQGAYSGSAVVEWCVSLIWDKFHMLALEMQRFWVWMVGTFRKKGWMVLNSDEGGARPEHNLGKIMCLLTKSNSITWK